MTDSYDLHGITVTPRAGGYYDLTHPALVEPVKVRGRENAELRAAELAMALNAPPEDEAAPPEQGDDGTVPPNPETPPELPPAPEPTPEPTPAAVETPTYLPKGLPRDFTRPMTEKQRKALGVPVKRIILEESGDIPPTGLFIGHNGKTYVLKPGEEADVPVFLLEILNNAVHNAPVVDPHSQKVIGTRPRMRYPYRIVT